MPTFLKKGRMLFGKKVVTIGWNEFHHESVKKLDSNVKKLDTSQKHKNHISL